MLKAAPGAADARNETETAAYLESEQWDRFVAENSTFAGWEAMQKAALEERFRRALGGK